MGVLKIRLSFRAVTAVLMIVVVSLLSNIVMLCQEVRDFDSPGSRDMDQYIGRYEGFRDVLPKRGVLGYVSDLPEVKGLKQYFLAQYELSPLIIAKTTDYPLVIGYFSDPTRIGQICKEHNLEPVRKLGNGAILFRKAKGG